MILAFLQPVLKAQYITIPDSAFRVFLTNNYPACMNGSGMLDTTCSAVINEVEIHNLNANAILNWQGFQYFKNLERVHFFSAHDLPVLPNTLKELSVEFGLNNISTLPPALEKLTIIQSGISSLPALPNTLKYLDCSMNPMLASIPTLPASLLSLNCSQMPGTGTPSNLTSLPALPPALETLSCSYCPLGNLPALPNSLRDLNCRNTGLSSLNSLPDSLRSLDCGDNSISTLPAIPSKLQILFVYHNNLSSIPALPNTLTHIDVTDNNLGSLPVLSSTSLRLLYAINSHLTTLPTLPNSLEILYAVGNQFTSLPTLPISLQTLLVASNQLTSLPNLPDTLQRLDCSGNQLTSLPTLTRNLYSLSCSNNHLTALPAFPNQLSEIYCTGNSNLHCLPFLTSHFISISMDSIITCIPNAVNNYNIQVAGQLYNPSNNPYPICNPTNNPNHCNSFPYMSGYVYNDNNNNLVKDANEPYRSNIRISLSNGIYSMTNSNGYYEVSADSIGTYSLSCAAPNYYNAIPAQYNYNFSSYDTIVTNNFALQANASVDSLSISVNPISWAARPGFPFSYLIGYENSGTTTLSPQIIFNYDNTRMTYDSSSNAAVLNLGNRLQLNQPAMVAGSQQSSFIAYFRINAATPIGDTIFVNGQATANAATASDSTYTVIRGAFDPNDKFATAFLSPADVAGGKDIFYNIRFQNTGNDTAFNIVIIDTLDNLLQKNTLKVINTSHPCKITVKDNVVYFEFINILLPDSNVNELKSHGFVSFRLRPVNTVTLNTSIPNKAAIYFDYNSPVITNTAITRILEPVVVIPPLNLLSFNVLQQTITTAKVLWTTSNEISVKDFLIEMSSDGTNFTVIGLEDPKGGSYNNYSKSITITETGTQYFRLKMEAISGNFIYSDVVTLIKEKHNETFSFRQNPAKDILTITLLDGELKNTTARIINLQGAVLQTFLLQNDIEYIDISRLATGNYILQTVKGSKRFSVRK